MGTTTITGQDTLVLYGRVFNDLAEGDVSSLTYPTDRVKMTTGKNQNTIYAKDEAGNNGDLTLRIVKGSDDDRFLNSKFSASEQDFATTELATGSLVKRLGDGQGNVSREVYTLGGGILSRGVDGKSNSSGDTGQGVAVYNMKFAKVVRSLQ